MTDRQPGPGVIALIGPMGAGKSSVGRRLAEQLNRDFIDLDAEIEKREGRSIAAIFDEDGESEFRRIEAEAFTEAVRRTGSVVACGGGVVTNPSNTASLEQARVVYLEVDASTAARRVEGQDARPLLAGGDVEERLTEIIASRRSDYLAAADVIVDARASVDDVVREILGRLESTR